MIALIVTLSLSIPIAIAMAWGIMRHYMRKDAYAYDVWWGVQFGGSGALERGTTEPRITECSLSGVSFLSPFGHCLDGGEPHCFRALLEADARLRHPTREFDTSHGRPGGGA